MRLIGHIGLMMLALAALGSETVSLMPPRQSAVVCTNQFFDVVGISNGVLITYDYPRQAYGWLWQDFTNEPNLFATTNQAAAIVGLFRDTNGLWVYGCQHYWAWQVWQLQRSEDNRRWRTLSCLTNGDWNFHFPEDTNLAPARFYRLKTFSTNQ